MNLLYYFIVVILTSSVLRGGPGGRRLGKQDGVGVQALVVGHPLVVGHEGVDVAERAGGLRRVPGDHQRDGLLQPAVGYPHVYHSYYEDDHLSDDDLSDDDLSDDDLSDDDFWDDFWGDLFSDDDSDMSDSDMSDSDMSDSDDDDDGFYDYYRHQTLWDPPVTYRDGRQGAGSGQVLAKVDKGSLTASDEALEAESQAQERLPDSSVLVNEAQIRSSMEEKEQREALVRSLKEEREPKEAQKRSFEEEKQQNKAFLRSLREEKETQQGRSLEEKEERDALLRSLKKEKEEKEALQRSLKEIEDQKAALENALLLEKGRRQEVEDKVEDLTVYTQRLEDNRKLVKNVLEARDLNIQQLQKNIGLLKNMVKDGEACHNFLPLLEQELSQCKGEKESNIKTLDSIKIELLDLQNIFLELGVEVDSLNQVLEEKDKELKAMSEDCCDEDVDVLRAEHGLLKHYLSQANVQLGTESLEIKRLRGEVEKYYKLQVKFKEENEGLVNDIKIAEREKEALNKAIEAQEKQIHQFRASLQREKNDHLSTRFKLKLMTHVEREKRRKLLDHWMFHPITLYISGGVLILLRLVIPLLQDWYLSLCRLYLSYI